VLRELEKLGHSWRVTAGPKFAAGDAALLHVDCTVVGPDYLALQSRYPRTINFATADISKRVISSARVHAGDAWSGPVIVKGNLNAGGSMEAKHNDRAAAAGCPPPHPGSKRLGDYRVYPAIGDVDAAVWDDADLIVERFLPEIDPDGSHVLRTWVFMGTHERCTRQVAPDQIVKASRIVRYEPAEVPEELRAARERLGFDYGKFDFVIHDGRPILLDANRTPGSALPVLELMRAGARNLAEGLAKLIERPA
jgi:hypothetical protein